MSTHILEEILHPQSIAVVGASPRGTGATSVFVSPLIERGFKGKIYLVNPKYSEILGIKTYSNLREIPGSVDYVISMVPASGVLNILADCPQKGVKCVHLYTGRFGETGRREASELEQEILKQARKWGIRLIGPNCMGVYYPREGISFGSNSPEEPGSVGLVSQSGSVASEFIGLASRRGVYFSKAISYGNALDFNESDYLDYFSQDAETKQILMYIEGVKDGKRFFNTLRQAASAKPVIILKGGRGKSGARAAASHTASLAGPTEIWETAVTQAGAVSAENLEELVDLAVSFYFLPPIRGRRVGITGGMGGASVLAADQCEEAGLDVVPLPADIQEELRSKGLPTWDWIGNPVDRTHTRGADFTTGDMLQVMANNQNFDLLITIMGDGPQREGISAEVHLAEFKPEEENRKPLLTVVSDRSLGNNDYDDRSRKVTGGARTKLIAANIPVYPTIARAARAARKLLEYYQRRK